MATDPYRNFNFIVEIDGLEVGGFSDASGFGASTDPIEYREGGDPARTRKLAGMTKYPNLVLKYGITDKHVLLDWYEQVVEGVIDRRQGRIKVLDVDGTAKMAWNFYGAWPTKWDAPDFSAKGNDVALETLELAVERIELDR